MADPTLYADLIDAGKDADQWLASHAWTAPPETVRAVQGFRDGVSQLEEALAAEIQDEAAAARRLFPFFRRKTR